MANTATRPVQKRELERAYARIQRGDSTFVAEERAFFGNDIRARGTKLRRTLQSRGLLPR